ncbi:MAG: hypothetical protein GTN93_27695 [Anaerolineae bacterium]|nr:hypothetical protein [Anaerolineae bacterium]
MWHILSTDGWPIAALVFSPWGFVFGVVGTALTISIVAAFVGLPFAELGGLVLSAGVALLAWRYQMAHRTVEVLEHGEATLGENVSVRQNYQVRVNGRYPWTLQHRYQVLGREYAGRVTTASRPHLSEQPGPPVYVLHTRVILVGARSIPVHTVTMGCDQGTS